MFAALYQWAFAGEHITWHYGVSAVLVLIGLYLFYRHEFQAHGIQLHS